MAFTQKDLSNWVDLYTQELVNYTVHKVADKDSAQDLVQDTFLAATKSIVDFKGNSSPKTWLVGILKRKIADYYRKLEKTPKPVNPQNSETNEANPYFKPNGAWEQFPLTWQQDEHLLDNMDFLKILKRCSDNLPQKWAFALEQKYILNTSANEICNELEISPTNYWQIIHRAKLQLRACLETNWFKNLR